MNRGFFKRAFDLTVSAILALVFLLPFFFICAAIRATSPGPAIYWSERVGRHNVVFRMPKFRSMRLGTPIVASHLIVNPEEYITPLGRILRKSSLDEVPQIWSVLVGHMSLIGPRPALPSQFDLIRLRSDAGVDYLRPGITGWAQVNGRDELTVEQKVSYEVEYLRAGGLGFDLKILLLTVLRVLTRKGVSH